MSRTWKDPFKHGLQRTGLLRWYYDLYPQKPLYIQSLFQYLRLSRWVMFLHMRLRMLYFLIRNGFQIKTLSLQSSANPDRQTHIGHVIRHNLTREYLSTRFSRRRSEHLIYLVRAIEAKPPRPQVLSIGPKNEGEILLWRAHGFKDVRGIDLFTYSPWIELMDMHHMTFPDSTFDILSSGYVIRYSDDLRQCVREMIRVVKDGGLIAVAFSASTEESANTPEAPTKLYGGTRELLRYFEPHVKQVYWQMDDANRDESQIPENSHSVVFSVKK